MTINIKTMNVDALLKLREQVASELQKKRHEIEDQIKRLGGDGNGVMRGRRRRNSMLGRKVPPKYRGPKGETWAGRGAKPRWLVALLKRGNKIEKYAIK